MIWEDSNVAFAPFGQLLALTLASYGISMNAVAPGLTDTDQTRLGLSEKEIDRPRSDPLTAAPGAWGRPVRPIDGRRVVLRERVNRRGSSHEGIHVGNRDEDFHPAVGQGLGDRELIEVERVVVVNGRPEQSTQLADGRNLRRGGSGGRVPSSVSTAAPKSGRKPRSSIARRAIVWRSCRLEVGLRPSPRRPLARTSERGVGKRRPRSPLAGGRWWQHPPRTAARSCKQPGTPRLEANATRSSHSPRTDEQRIPGSARPEVPRLPAPASSSTSRRDLSSAFT